MVNEDVVRRARKSMAISGRYDKERNHRRDWTPAQKRRMRKKFRRHGMTPPSFTL